MHKPKLIIFASGTMTGGGSGFENLANKAREGILGADIVAVVSNHANGGVREKADRLNVPFRHFPGPFTAEEYAKIVKDYGAEFAALSGWLKLVAGLDPKTTVNIHPGQLPRFGGAGMYGHHVHEAVIEAYKRGETDYSQVTMHFVTEKYDEGPVIFRSPKIMIGKEDTAELLAQKILEVEHYWQPIVTDHVVRGEIRWDGKDPKTLIGAIDLTSSSL